MRAVIQKAASDDEVDAAARKVDAHIRAHANAKAQVHRIANRIIDAGKLENYGTARAQEHLKRWASNQ